MKIYLFLISSIIFLSTTQTTQAKSINDFAGYFVKEKGKTTLWYINPQNKLRSEITSPADLKLLMLKLPEVSRQALDKIPLRIIPNTTLRDKDRDGLIDSLEKAIGTDPAKIDSDQDGFNDKQEIALGYDPRSKGRYRSDNAIRNKHRGQIVVETGQASYLWYISPSDRKRVFIEPNQVFFNELLKMSTVIDAKTLGRTAVEYKSYDLASIEQETFRLVNKEREKNGLRPLVWNEKVAEVSRGHSLSLLKENKTITALDRVCDFPLIHHEGLDIGHYQNNRLNHFGIYYFSASGENIVLTPAISQLSFTTSKDIQGDIDKCQKDREVMRDKFKKKNGEPNDQEFANKEKTIRDEIKQRSLIMTKQSRITPSLISWEKPLSIESESVTSWMNSPGHKANILNADYDEGGMGAAYINGYFIITQVFIRRADCGYKSGKCCEKEGYYPYCFNPYNCQDNTCQ